jgi:hypothetical protein
MIGEAVIKIAICELTGHAGLSGEAWREKDCYRTPLTNVHDGFSSSVTSREMNGTAKSALYIVARGS